MRVKEMVVKASTAFKRGGAYHTDKRFLLHLENSHQRQAL